MARKEAAANLLLLSNTPSLSPCSLAAVDLVCGISSALATALGERAGQSVEVRALLRWALTAYGRKSAGSADHIVVVWDLDS